MRECGGVATARDGWRPMMGVAADWRRQCVGFFFFFFFFFSFFSPFVVSGKLFGSGSEEGEQALPYKGAERSERNAGTAGFLLDCTRRSGGGLLGRSLRDDFSGAMTSMNPVMRIRQMQKPFCRMGRSFRAVDCTARTEELLVLCRGYPFGRVDIFAGLAA